MEASATMIEAIQTIVNPLFKKAEEENQLAEFYLHLSKSAFRPLPGQVRTLSIHGALGRWSDLKSVVRQQLTNEIVTKWTAFANAPKNESEEKFSIEDELNKNTIDQIPEPAPAVKTVSKKTDPENTNPYLRVNTRRDWFDILLDFVAALITPADASYKS